jgi:hypothetical protein
MRTPDKAGAKPPVNAFPYRPEFWQFRNKHNEIAQAMYAAYLVGHSLRSIARMYRMSESSVCSRLSRRGFKLRSKQLNGLQMVGGYRFTWDGCKSLRGSVNGRVIRAHRYVWEKHNGPIPAGHHIHFKDGNRQNVCIENRSA